MKKTVNFVATITVLVLCFLLETQLTAYAVSKIKPKNTTLAQDTSTLLINKNSILLPSPLYFSNDDFTISANPKRNRTIITFTNMTSVRSVTLVKPGCFYPYSEDTQTIAGTCEYIGDLSVYGSEGTWEVLYSQTKNEYYVVVFTSKYLNWEYLSNVWLNHGNGIKICDSIEINRIHLTIDDARQMYRKFPIDYLFGLEQYYDAPLFIASWCEEPDSILIFVHDN